MKHAAIQKDYRVTREECFCVFTEYNFPSCDISKHQISSMCMRRIHFFKSACGGGGISLATLLPPPSLTALFLPCRPTCCSPGQPFPMRERDTQGISATRMKVHNTG